MAEGDQVAKKGAEEEEEEEEEEEDGFEEGEKIPCSLNYVAACILMPLLDGLLIGFPWPGFTLYYKLMGWPVARAGIAMTIGYLVRMFTQQAQVKFGYWLALPMAMCHMTTGILALIFTTSEWAIFTEMVAFTGFSPTIAIEGIAFDTFGSSESLARQATSTCLSVYTFGLASSSTFGGIVYDNASWTGVALYHVSGTALLTLLFVLQPACRRSFVATFCGKAEQTEETEDSMTDVVPNQPVESIGEQDGEAKCQLPGVVEDMQVVEVSAGQEQSSAKPRGTQMSAKPRGTQMSDVGRTGRGTQMSDVGRTGRETQMSDVGRTGRETQMSDIGRKGRGTQMTQASGVGKGARGTQMTQMSNYSRSDNLTGARFSHWSGIGSKRGTQMSRRPRGTEMTTGTGGTGWTMRSRARANSGRSGNTKGTALTALSRLTHLSEAGETLRHLTGTNSALQPTIATSTGEGGVLRDVLLGNAAQELVPEDELGPVHSFIPKDLRIPALLLFCNSFCSYVSYVVEFATYSIFFKEVHNWDQATFASMAQTSGDLVAAIAIQVIPFVMPEIDPEEAGFFGRNFHYMTSPPWGLGLTIFFWVLCNLGMMSPLLPITIAAQVLMGTNSVFNAKMSTEMNLFYSLGDPDIFMKLQVFCRTAEAIGGICVGLIVTGLYAVDPFAPYYVTTALATVVFLLYISGFYKRVGYGDDIEVAEEKRSRRLGVKRVSSWAVVTSKDTGS